MLRLRKLKHLKFNDADRLCITMNHPPHFFGRFAIKGHLAALRANPHRDVLNQYPAAVNFENF